MNQTPQGPAVVVGVDGSAPSILALRWADALAPLFHTHIKAVTAWQFQIAFGTFTPVVWRPDEEARHICAEAVAKAFGGAPPEGLEMTIRQGTPAKVLIDESRSAPLIVLGSRGHGGFEELLLGTVSAAVAEHAKCSVLIAHGTDLPAGISAIQGQGRTAKEENARGNHAKS